MLSGLEVQLTNGEWFQVNASLSLFVVLADDAFMVMYFFLSLINIKPCKVVVVVLSMSLNNCSSIKTLIL